MEGNEEDEFGFNFGIGELGMAVKVCSQLDRCIATTNISYTVWTKKLFHHSPNTILSVTKSYLFDVVVLEVLCFENIFIMLLLPVTSLGNLNTQILPNIGPVESICVRWFQHSSLS